MNRAPTCPPSPVGSSPMSKTVTMFGWSPRRPMAWASRVMRWRAATVKAFGLDQGEGDVAVEAGVVGEVDLLLAALAEELSDDVAAVGEGRGWNGSTTTPQRLASRHY